MKDHFIHELNNLLSRISIQGTRVAETIDRSICAFTQSDTEEAARIIEQDKFIDAEEIRIEEECLKLLALYQPVATDLRTLVSVLKINAALERMADFAVHMAERTINTATCTRPPASETADFSPMQKMVQRMLHDTLRVITRTDIDLAYKVIELDNAVNSLRREHRTHARTALNRTPGHADFFLECHGLARDLERTADLCTDICEYIIYMKTARIIRHENT